MQSINKQIQEQLGEIKAEPQESGQEQLKISEDPDRFELAKNAFWIMAQKVARQELKSEFVIDSENKTEVAKFVAWFTGDLAIMQKFDIHPAKGIYIMGNPGSGKSMLFRIVKACMKHEEYGRFFRGFNMYTTEHVAKLFMKEGDAGIETFTTKCVSEKYGKKKITHCCFDDLGSEEIKNNYGNKKEVMVDVILQRYDMMLEHGLITHFTGNLTLDEIGDRYSDRVKSRLNHMCNIIKLGGTTEYKDRR